MAPFSRKDLIEAIRKVGIVKGDVIDVSCQFQYLGPFNDLKIRSIEEYFETIVECFFEVVGEEGTLVVPTHTTQVGHHKVPFILEETRPSTGLFPEHIVKRPDSVRSLHPIYSYCAIGKRKHEICGNVSQSNFGIDSPCDRMHNLNAKGVLLGIVPMGENSRSLSIIHYVEARFNPPYVYNKLIDVDVYASGKKVRGPFAITVRYLDFNIHYGPKRTRAINGRLIDKGMFLSCPVGGKGIHAVSYVDYVREAVAIMKEDMFGLLQYPPEFRKGVIPYA